jgi:hypothetical protein
MFYDGDSYEKLHLYEHYSFTIGYTSVFGCIYFIYLIINLSSAIANKVKQRGK